MEQEFYDRINLKNNLSFLSKKICVKYDLGEYISDKLILVGYEDFNYILKTDKGKYCIKIFNKERNKEDIKKYLDRILLASTLNINTPKIYKTNNNILCEINLNNITYRLCVFEYIDGKSFHDLKKFPSTEEFKNIIYQMVQIHKQSNKIDFIYDNWTITNIVEEYERKVKYLNYKYNRIIKKLVEKFKTINFSLLPKCYIHGDIISSNIIKDKNGKLWIIDFGVANYLPRIVDIVVMACNLCLNPLNKRKTRKNIKLLLSEYQKYNKLTDYEIECLPLFYELVNAIGILQLSYLTKIREDSKEDKIGLSEYKNGLNFSSKRFWAKILN